MRKISMQDAFNAQARTMVEFGYPSITAKLVAEHHAIWKRGDTAKDVVFAFNKKAFEDHPELFGEPDKE